MTDIQNDEGLCLLKERLEDAANSGAISLLKTASVDVDFEDIVDSAFADTENRLFPIYSPEMTVMSAMYMQTQDVDPLVKEACAQALKEWGIDSISVEPLVKEAADNMIPEELYLLRAAKKLPVIDEASLEKSASVLNGNMQNLSIAERVEASVNLYKIATEQYGVKPEDLSEYVIRYAQEASCDLNKLAMSITERYAETHNADYKSMIQKIASLKEELGSSVSYDKSLNAGITYDLFALDKEAGVTDIFDAVLDVHNTPFIYDEDGTLSKSASENTVIVGRYSISETELYKIAEDSFENAFPGISRSLFEDGVMSVEKVESFVKEIPSSAVDALGKYMAGAC